MLTGFRTMDLIAVPDWRLCHEAAVREKEPAVLYAGAAVEAVPVAVCGVREAGSQQGRPVSVGDLDPLVAEFGQALLLAVGAVEVFIEGVEAMEIAAVLRSAEASDQAPALLL